MFDKSQFKLFYFIQFQAVCCLLRRIWCRNVANTTSSSHMHVMNHNWSAIKQRLHPQSVAEISRHSVLSGDTTNREAQFLFGCLQKMCCAISWICIINFYC